jgi:hypothetical protein
MPEASAPLGLISSAVAVRGIGWTYAAAAARSVIGDVLADVVVGRSTLDVPGAAEAMARAVRNIGRPGIAATARKAAELLAATSVIWGSSSPPSAGSPPQARGLRRTPPDVRS